jgi:hypothetical protein
MCFGAVEVLYRAPYLACKRCHGLAYRTENLTPLWRRREKLSKLQLKAGADATRLPCVIPPKPKWQRWHTYLALREAIREADTDFAAAFARARMMR